jgi:hypothetical protein
MMGRYRLFLWELSTLLVMVLGSLTWVAAEDKGNPHEINGRQPVEYCQACHLQAPETYQLPSSIAIVPDWRKFQSGMDGTSMCVECHNQSEQSHEVGGDKIDFTVPADLPLSSENTLTCMTCHFMHGSLSSDRPWASVSFMDKLTGHVRLHKSYLLRRNNSNGELCLVCHSTGSGPK